MHQTYRRQSRRDVWKTSLENGNYVVVKKITIAGLCSRLRPPPPPTLLPAHHLWGQESYWSIYIYTYLYIPVYLASNIFRYGAKCYTHSELRFPAPFLQFRSVRFSSRWYIIILCARKSGMVGARLSKTDARSFLGRPKRYSGTLGGFRKQWRKTPKTRKGDYNYILCVCVCVCVCACVCV